MPETNGVDESANANETNLRTWPEGTIVLSLPMPPSLNRLWRSCRRGGKVAVYPSPIYAKWRMRAELALIEQFAETPAPETIEGSFELTIVVDQKKRHTSDLDNRAKATADLLEGLGFVRNDKFQDRLVVEWGDAPMGAVVALRATARPTGPIKPEKPVRKRKASTDSA